MAGGTGASQEAAAMGGGLLGRWGGRRNPRGSGGMFGWFGGSRWFLLSSRVAADLVLNRHFFHFKLPFPVEPTTPDELTWQQSRTKCVGWTSVQNTCHNLVQIWTKTTSWTRGSTIFHYWRKGQTASIFPEICTSWFLHEPCTMLILRLGLPHLKKNNTDTIQTTFTCLNRLSLHLESERKVML
jgi:hypothetical protein